MKSATQQFIEDARAGGYKELQTQLELRYMNGDVMILKTFWGKQEWVKLMSFHKLLLDPLVWQAVGKKQAWLKYTREDGCSVNDPANVKDWKITWNFKQHRFIDHLADGKTIEEALSALAS